MRIVLEGAHIKVTDGPTASIAQHWRLPECIVQGIIHHHTPQGQQPICHATCLANAVAKQATGKLELGSSERDDLAQSMDFLGLTENGLDQLCETATRRFGQISDRINEPAMAR